MYIGKKVTRIQPISKKDLRNYKKYSPESYEKLIAQEKQINEINKAEKQYEKDENYEKIISFWESVFQNGGLTFGSMSWTFRLVDLYIAGERYDDALRILSLITDNIYQNKVTKYQERIFKKNSNRS